MPTSLTDKSKSQTEKKEVTVIYGANTYHPHCAGKTVAEVRKIFTEGFKLEPDAYALINGKETTENYILQEGDTLEFKKESGQKG